MSVQQMQEHVEALAKAFNVTIEYDDSMGVQGRANAKRRIVCFAHVTEERIYAAALHELGHVVAPLGCLHSDILSSTQMWNLERAGNLILEEERAAWDWARYYALEWTPTMAETERKCYGSYTSETPVLLAANKMAQMVVETDELDAEKKASICDELERMFMANRFLELAEPIVGKEKTAEMRAQLENVVCQNRHSK